MTFDPAWEDGHRKHTWARWPNLRFVEFAMRTFGPVAERPDVMFVELGCGGGAQLAFLAEEGFACLGIDASEAAIAKARALFQTRLIDTDIPASLGDVTRVQFEPGAIDCAVDVCTLQHLPGPEAQTVIRNARLWLKPTGVLWSMMARELAPIPVDTPAPRLLRTRDEVVALFGEGWSLRLGEETVYGVDARVARHWIIEARPVEEKPSGD